MQSANGKDHPEAQPPIGDRVEQETHERYAATFTHPTSTFWRRISTPRQEHQVGRFLSLFEERLARRTGTLSGRFSGAIEPAPPLLPLATRFAGIRYKGVVSLYDFDRIPEQYRGDLTYW